MYSIFAALNSNVSVFAFEPESNNFQTLMNNIDQNNLYKFITPYPIGISNNTELSELQISKFEAGSSHHTVGKNLLDHKNLEVISNSFSQGIFSTTIDDLCFNWKLPIPSYLSVKTLELYVRERECVGVVFGVHLHIGCSIQLFVFYPLITCSAQVDC